MIYLASPYSGTPEEQEERFQAVCCKAAELMRDGHMVFSPIAHSHPIAFYGLPKDFGFWEKMDCWWIRACTKIVVLMLPGWELSVGVRAEIDYAKQIGKAVSYLKPDEQYRKNQIRIGEEQQQR